MFNFNSKLHWTTTLSERALLAVIGCLTMIAAGVDVYQMWVNLSIELADLFLLFIYAEIIGMVGAFTQAIEYQSLFLLSLQSLLFAG